MDFPSKGELIANQKHQNIEEIRDYLGVTSLSYLSEEKLLEGAPNTHPETGFCTACFTGNYPIQIEGLDEFSKSGLDD